MSIKAPKSMIFLTVPSSSSPTCKSSNLIDSDLSNGLSNSSRGSSDGVLIYLITSSIVYLSVLNNLMYLFSSNY